MKADVPRRGLVRGNWMLKWPWWMRVQNIITFLGIIAAPVAVAALGLYGWLLWRSMERAGWGLKHLTELLYLWQAQTGVAFAVAAALIGAAAVLHQTAATQRVEDVRKARRFTALRAVLPFLLSELADYAAGCAELYAQLLEHPPGMPITALGSQFPSLPVGLADRLTEMVEAIEEEHARPLVLLSKQVQIHYARVQDTKAQAAGRHGAILVRHNALTRLVDAAEVYARCEGLFLYARGEIAGAATPIQADDVRRALFLMLPHLADTEELVEEINRRAARSKDGRQWPES